MKTEVTWLAHGEVRVRLIPEGDEEIRLVKALQDKEPGGQRWHRDQDVLPDYGVYPHQERPQPGALVIYLHDPAPEVPEK